MRSVISLSLPLSKRKEVEKKAKKANKTISAYVLDALNLVDQMISEDELVSIAKKAKKEHKMGKTKKLNSLKDLMR